MQIFNQYKKYLVLGSALILLSLFTVWYFNEKKIDDVVNTFANEVITTEGVFESNNTSFYVDVKGAVKKPGVYEFKDGDKVIDAIEKAGGLAKNGITSNINLSQKLKSEMVIYIFTKGELTTKNETSQKNVMTTNIPCKCETIEVNNCITKEDTSKEAITNDAQTNTKININIATAEEFTKLSGIGLAKAESIINYRTKNGNFKTIEDIKNVSGLGDALFEKIKDDITV